LGQPTLPDPRQRFSGNGNGWGYNLGALLSLSERLSLGISYRSEISVDIDGQVLFDRPLAALRAIIPDANGSAELKLPQQLFLGLHLRLNEKLSGEIGLRWEGWSSFQALRIKLDRTVAGQQRIEEDKNWRDTYTYNLGLEYRPTDRLSLQAGYMFGKNPVPDSTFEPAIPDADFHLLTVGSQLMISPGLRCGMSYGLQVHENRSKNNGVGAASLLPANGYYDSLLHLLAIDFSYQF
jgi:long-chain fatty acid transport protein